MYVLNFYTLKRETEKESDTSRNIWSFAQKALSSMHIPTFCLS